MRRLLLAVIICFSTKYNWLQLMLCMWLNQFYTMFVVHVRLQDCYSAQVVEELNEIIIMLTVYHFFCFTDFVQDTGARANYVGLSMVSITVMNMAVNLIPILIDTTKVLKSKLRKRFKRVNRYLREKENIKRRIKRERRRKF